MKLFRYGKDVGALAPMPRRYLAEMRSAAA